MFNENDVWVRVLDGVARVGISDYMQQKLTDISYFEPPKMDAVVEQFGELGSVESAKAVFEIISPVSGTLWMKPHARGLEWKCSSAPRAEAVCSKLPAC